VLITLIFQRNKKEARERFFGSFNFWNIYQAVN